MHVKKKIDLPQVLFQLDMFFCFKYIIASDNEF